MTMIRRNSCLSFCETDSFLAAAYLRKPDGPYKFKRSALRSIGGPAVALLVFSGELMRVDAAVTAS